MFSLKNASSHRQSLVIMTVLCVLAVGSNDTDSGPVSTGPVIPLSSIEGVRSDVVAIPKGGLPPFCIPVATLEFLLSLLHIRLVLCSPVTSVVALGCNNFCKCRF